MRRSVPIALLASLWLQAQTPIDFKDFKGRLEFAPKTKEACLILDGQTTYGILPAARIGALNLPLTLEAWVALGAYPFSETPILDAMAWSQGGLYLAIRPDGRACATVGCADGRSGGTNTEAPLSLRRWHHLALRIEARQCSLFVDGALTGSFTPANTPEIPPTLLPLEAFVGRSRGATRPEGALRPEASAKAFAFLDGALENLRFHDRALSDAEIREAFQQRKHVEQTPLPPRVLPAGPQGPGPFGAFPTTLSFYPQWDSHWRIGDAADVVVRFDSFPGRFVFWHGTSYIPHWVTENGIWYTNEFNETWGGIKGCGEPMSDKQCRYSRVAVLESSEARAVVHWRYALTDVFYEIARANPEDGWGDWTDEIHTIYPDGTSIRQITLHTSAPEAPHEWHEAIVVMGPGWKPEQALHPEALTLLDGKGKGRTFSWKDATPPEHPDDALAPSIQVVHTRSRHQPFAMIRPQDKPTFNIFSKEVRREVSIFPWWNHWPVGTAASDGRYAFADDRPSHSSLCNLAWGPYAEGKDWTTKLMLAGLTDKSPEALLPTLKAWASPPECQATGATQAHYDPAQKAFVATSDGRSNLSLELKASQEHPVVNPALVLKQWGNAKATLVLDGKAQQPGPSLRLSPRIGLEGTDLIVWLQLERDKPVRIELRR